MKLSVSAYRAHASAHKKILSNSYQASLNYGSTSAGASASSTSNTLFSMDPTNTTQSTINVTPISCTAISSTSSNTIQGSSGSDAYNVSGVSDGSSSSNSNINPSAGGVGQKVVINPIDTTLSSGDGKNVLMVASSKDEEEDSSNAASSDNKSPGQRTKSNQRWMKLRTTVQISSAMQKKPPLKREDSFLKRFSTRQIPETQETMEETGSESASGDQDKISKRRRRYIQKRISVVNPDENFYFYWLMVLTVCILYNLWALIVRQSFPELQNSIPNFWFSCDCISDVIFVLDIAVQLRTGYLEQGLMVYDDKKLATHYMRSKKFLFDLAALLPLDLLQIKFGTQPLIRFPRFLKVYRSVKFYYIVESRTVWPNLWRVVNLIHILLILAHWFGCFYFLLSEAEGFQGDWVYPYRPGDYATLTRKYLGSLYWSTLTLTTIGDLPTPETNAEPSTSVDGPRSIPRRGLKSRLLQFASNYGYIFTIVSYLIGVFIFATIVGQVGNVITNRNANRLEFERLLDGAKTYMRHHKVPGGMKRRVLRWYDYSWSRGRIQGGGDINTALGLLPDKLKTELALHVNLSVLKKVTIFQECQPEFLHDLVLKMKAYIFTPGDSICRKGEVAREMFIIADGILEVLSETGKVLTTMKAGDFFGEIGILNLDGLNKRTADVRSVGYSELFSLSREDVLTAMKDYPEAQEILQTLGRKRLMEVRCVNKKHAKNVSDKEAITSNLQHAQVDNSSENSTSKRIVDKLRSDVKGIKNVLKKTRTTGRRSNESIELQPLHTGGLMKTPKGVLRRMPRVRSDDFNTDGDEQHHIEHVEKTSPIGAGLPLLQRLRLLKEKQDREERAVRNAPTTIMISSPIPPSSSSTSATTTHINDVSPQKLGNEESEPEIIGAGLPLLQRLKMLKAKEENLAKECHAKAQAAYAYCQSMTIHGTGTSVLSSAFKTPLATSPTSSTSALIPSPVSKTALKVSFRDRIKSLQQQQHQQQQQQQLQQLQIDNTTKLLEKDVKKTELKRNHELREQLISTLTNINNNNNHNKYTNKPSALSLKDKIKQFGHQATSSPKLTNFNTDEQLKPWSKLKLATVVSTGGSYASLCGSFNENSPTEESTKKFSNLKFTLTTTTTTSTTTLTTPSITIPSTISIITTNDNITNRTSSSYYSPSDNDQKNNNSLKIVPKLQLKTKTSNKLQLNIVPKKYTSVDDLSPEYSGLPFVKKLKILNERQKLAELESVMKTRSVSLDCTESINEVYPIESLTRSHSDTSGINARSTAQSLSPSQQTPSSAIKQIISITPVITSQSSLLSSSSSLSSTVTPATAAIRPSPLTIPQCLQSPLSPESNETMERRHLKSILKKLSEERNYQSSDTVGLTDFNGLLRAPTVEGPPSSATSYFNQDVDGSHFPVLNTNNAQHFLDTTQSTLATTTTVTTALISATNDESFLVNNINNNNNNKNINNNNTNNNYDNNNNNNNNNNSSTNSRIDDIEKLEKNYYAEDVRTTTTTTTAKHSAFISRKFIKGSIEEHEYFGEVLLGIKQVIQNHLREVQLKFQDKFQTLEMEVQQRDELIDQLQLRINELESNITTTPQSSNNLDRIVSSETYSTGSSGEIPFVRGDSLDTIFATSPVSDPDERNRTKMKSKKRNSPRRRQIPISASQEGSTDQETSQYNEHYHVSDLTGNLTRKPDSIILNMDESTSPTVSGASSDDSSNEYNNDELQSDDWEIRMLAAELNRRESRKEEQQSSSGHSATAARLSDEDSSEQVLRQRRKISDTIVYTDVDLSDTGENDNELLTRPRASSLDQHNIRRQTTKTIYKAMSFDRDKDRL